MSSITSTSALLVALLLGATLTVGPQSALAEEHPLLERARHAADRADFQAARELLAELPAELELTRAELRAALLLRANLEFALENPEAMARNLALFVRCDPAAEPPAGLSPLFMERIAAERALASPTFVDAELTSEGDSVQVNLSASPTDELVQQVRLYFRSDATPDWTEQNLDAGNGAVLAREVGLELYAELVGLGGAVLATSGSRDEPHRVASGPSRRRLPAWPFVLGAVVIAAAVAVGLGVGLSVDDDVPTDVSPPVVAW